jgi:hypothetical protein
MLEGDFSTSAHLLWPQDFKMQLVRCRYKWLVWQNRRPFKSLEDQFTSQNIRPGNGKLFFFQLKTDNKLFESVSFGWSHSHQKLTVWTNSCTIELLKSYLSEFGAEADTTSEKKGYWSE